MTTEDFTIVYEKLQKIANHPELDRLLEELAKIIEEKEGIKVECDRRKKKKKIIQFNRDSRVYC